MNLLEHIASWLSWEHAPLIEVGTVGGQRFIGIVDYQVKPDDTVLGIDQHDNQYVVVPAAHITYAMPISLTRGEQWPAWARAQSADRTRDLH